MLVGGGLPEVVAPLFGAGLLTGLLVAAVVALELVEGLGAAPAESPPAAGFGRFERCWSALLLAWSRPASTSAPPEALPVSSAPPEAWLPSSAPRLALPLSSAPAEALALSSAS